MGALEGRKEALREISRNFRETSVMGALEGRKEALREISRNFRETSVLGALEGRYLAGPATWNPHLEPPPSGAR